MTLDPVFRAYGLDRAGGRIFLARRERGRTSLVVSGTPGDPAVVRALAGARAEVEAGRAAWAVATPPEATFLKELRTPLRSASKAARVWGGLLDVELPVPLDELSWAVANEESAPDGRRAVVAAIEKREARAFLACLAAEGVSATHLDACPAALHALLPREPRSGGYRVLVWLGDDSVTAVGGSARARGTSALRSFHLLRTEPRNDDAFVSRFVVRAAHFLDLDRGPAIYWAGPAARPDLLRALEKALAAAGVTAGFAVLPGGEGALACKLAERAAAAATLQLAPDDAIPPAWTARCRRLADRWRLAAAAGAVALIAVCGVVLHLRAAELARVREAFAATAAGLAAPGHPLKPGREFYDIMRDPHKGALRARALAFRQLGPGAAGIAPDLDAILGAARDAGVDVAHCEISATAASVELAAGTPPGAVDAFADAFAAAGWEVSRPPAADGRAKFEGVRGQ